MAVPSVLDSHLVEVEQDGARVAVPLLRALQSNRHVAAQAAILDALPRDVLLAALVALEHGRARHGLLVPWRMKLLDTIGAESREWAIAQADAYPAGPYDPQAYLKQYIFLALVRSGVPIERRCEHLYPNVTGASLETLVECARGLSDDRRAAVLAEHFPKMAHGAQIVAAIPEPELVRALLASAEPGGPRFDALLSSMRALAANHDAVREAVERFVASLPKPIPFIVTAIVKPTSEEELPPIAREQLRIAGRGYDGNDLDASERLAENGEETSFHGFLEIRTIADPDGTPRFDMLIYMVDSGSIFEAGTTREVGGVSQGGVALTVNDVALRAGLQAAMLAKNSLKATA